MKSSPLLRHHGPGVVVQSGEMAETIAAFPSAIPTPELPKTIEILTKYVQHVLLDFHKVHSVFADWLVLQQSLQGVNAEDKKLCKETLTGMKKIFAAKGADWKRVDAQISVLESTISRFEKEIELIKTGTKWDVDARKEMMDMEKEKQEKLIQELMVKEREKCQAIGCNCLSREKLGNLDSPGEGTRARDAVYRKKILALLADRDLGKAQKILQEVEKFLEREVQKNQQQRSG
jgi:hypothetical protein